MISILDREAARVFDVETRVVNQQVSRHAARFTQEFVGSQMPLPRSAFRVAVESKLKRLADIGVTGAEQDAVMHEAMSLHSETRARERLAMIRELLLMWDLERARVDGDYTPFEQTLRERGRAPDGGSRGGRRGVPHPPNRHARHTSNPFRLWITRQQLRRA